MTHRKLLLQAVVVSVLGLYALVHPAAAADGSHARLSQCVWCWTVVECPEEETLRALCASRGCGTTGVYCGWGIGACTGMAQMGCLSEPQ